MTYLELDFRITPLQPASDILIAELSELGFESFVEKNDGLLAYVDADSFNREELKKINILQHPDVEILWSSKTIGQQNWNAEWERNFHPIKINDQCMVRAPFHKAETVTYDIVIEPKMSFGTGHHETTFMMLQHILTMDLENKTVLDMGCGTAVLAILAAKRGAAHVDAIDIDTWCYENSLENIARNDCSQINVFLGDSSLLGSRTYDVIIANINRNILLDDIPRYAGVLHQEGRLLLSGFYARDLKIIEEQCEDKNLFLEHHLEKNSWVASIHKFS